MNRDTFLIFLAVFTILLATSSGFAQEDTPQDHGTSPEQSEDADAAVHGESEDHGGRPHHANDVAVFLGATDEHGHPTEFTWGLDYRRIITRQWAVGALFDYAGGDLRNSVVAASVTWFPVGRLALTAAPGVEFHDGRGSDEACNCPQPLNSTDGGGHGETDKDATYFLFRLGAGWHFPIGQDYGVAPNVNVDFVNGEQVLVYGFHFTYAW